MRGSGSLGTGRRDESGEAEVRLGHPVRRGTGADLSAVVGLERESATAPHWGLGEYEGIVTGVAGGVRRCLMVVEGGDGVAGFAVGSVVAAEAEIESVVVRANEQRQGFGGALCRAVMAWAAEEGAREIRLEVRAGSVGAIRLYEGLGFVEVGRRPGYYDGPVDDAVLMRCGLVPSV